jgi:hypothetical protein
MLMDYKLDGANYKAGELCTTDAATEAGMVAAKVASATLTGGTTHVAEVSNIRGDVDVRGSVNPITGGLRLAGDYGLPSFGTPKIGLIGDSIMAADHLIGNLNQNANGIVTRLLGRTGVSARIASPYTAVVGRTTTQMLAALTADIATMKAAEVTHVFMNGGKNDRVGTDSTNANLLQIWNALLAAGFIVIDIGCLPTTDTGLQILTVEIGKAISRNKYAWDFGQRRSGYIYLDCFGPLLDYTSAATVAAGTPATNMLYDSTHPGPLGAERIAKQHSAVIASLFGANKTAPRYPFAGNAVPNSCMAGTAAAGGGSFTGNVPTSWQQTALSSGHTVVSSKVARSASLFADNMPGEVWRQVITNTAGNNNAYVAYQNIALPAGGLTAGLTAVAGFEAAWSAAASGKLMGCILSAGFNGAAAITPQGMNVADTTTVQAMNSTSDSGIFYTPEFTVPAGATQLSFWIYIAINSATVADTVTLDIGSAFCCPATYP